ncbi:hypothetical protein [Cohnella sp. WQ 127256]|nr:hypothetical protein [Cohnella sp. WQ 127256]
MSHKTKFSEVPERTVAGVTLAPYTIALRLRTLRTIFNFLAPDQVPENGI